MQNAEITGLTSEEVKKKKRLGLVNETIDSYTPSTFSIYRRNIFSLINIVVVPLMGFLIYYQQYRDVLAFTTFIFINTIISILDELRIKKQIEKLKNEFQISAVVIRDGKDVTIPSTEIVEGDYIKAKEGDGIIGDGVVISENYLQLDESALNGESNYIRKEKGEKVLSGSFIVTGTCIYKVESVGKSNYLNKVGSEALKFKQKKSLVQRVGDRLIFFLVVASLGLAFLNFYATGLGNVPIADRVLSITTIITLIIPQTLIFLYTLTFTISIAKLYSRGVLVQKGGSIEELSKIDVICFDKTGTITTNEMKIINTKYFNIQEDDFGSFYNSVRGNIVGINKTQEQLHKFYSKQKKVGYTDFKQIPFTSKNKYSLVSAKVNDDYYTIMFGAFSMVQNNIDPNLLEEVGQYVNEQEENGNRVLVGVFYKTPESVLTSEDLNLKPDDVVKQKSKSIVIYTIEEELNPGIKDIFERLRNQNIEVKIISGDSLKSVNRVLQKVGLNTDRIVDLSVDHENLENKVMKYDVFTRSKPEDKLKIINELKKAGLNVAMVGDGINDVLSLKASDVSIAMEAGSKIAREVADIVLLKNDYSKIPEIFYEGENIIFNLKTTTKIFLVKSFLAMMIALYFSAVESRIPLLPSSTLIFSFLGGSAPSYALVFTRQKIDEKIGFLKEILASAIPSSLIITATIFLFYFNIKTAGADFTTINTSLVMFILSTSLIYSLYLVWQAKKLRNLIYLFLIYGISMIIGSYETILPITNPRPVNDTLILLAGVLLGFVIVVVLLFKSIKPKKLWQKAAIIAGSGAGLTIASLFPFQTYYEVRNVPIEIYYEIFAISAIVIIGLLVVNGVVNFFLLRSKQ